MYGAAMLPGHQPARLYCQVPFCGWQPSGLGQDHFPFFWPFGTSQGPRMELN